MEDKKELYKALNKFRNQLKQPVKNEKNPFFKSNYVTLEGVMNAIDKALEGTGLSYMQLIHDVAESNLKGVETVIMHESGEVLKSGILTFDPLKKDPQGFGSTFTYSRRYQLAGMFGISSDIDDDGNAGSFVGTTNTNANNRYQRQPQQPPRQQKRQPTQEEIELSQKVKKYKHKLQELADMTNTTVDVVEKDIKKQAESSEGYQRMNRIQKADTYIYIANGFINELESPKREPETEELTLQEATPANEG